VPYIEISLRLTATDTSSLDLYIPFLFDCGCEGLVEKEGCLLAYISSDLFDRTRFENNILDYLPGSSHPSISYKHVPDKNWNEEWEKAYEPVVIAESCLVRAPFHDQGEGYRYEVIISPRMSFGTGHHETTRLIAGEVLEMDLTGKKVIDLGCGTGILAILSAMKGASQVTAIDLDENAVQNALENFRLNSLDNIKAVSMGLDQLDETEYDMIMANINRNVLYEHMDKITGIAGKNALLLLSGVYKDDVSSISERAGDFGWDEERVTVLNKWAMIRLRMK